VSVVGGAGPSAGNVELGGGIPGPGVVTGTVSRSQLRSVLRRLRRDRAATAGLIYLVLVVLLAICAPLVAYINGHPPNDITHQYEMTTDFGLPKGPNADLRFWLGADQFGRDLLTRTVYGARISLLVGLASTAVALVVGTAVGVVAGFLRGPLDTALSRTVDVVLCFPILLLGLAIRAVFGASLWVMIVIVAFATWPYIARIVRGQALVIREQEYVLAARALGAGNRRIMWRHVPPNLIGPLIVYGTLIIPVNILLEASLSYLGLGLQPPTATWGQMLADGQQYYATAWWMIAVPGFALLTTTIAFNLVGDGLRDALDPRSTQGRL
jgi:ABC-type dipeptide/oligopeptide/nickel transport system permease subunit